MRQRGIDQPRELWQVGKVGLQHDGAVRTLRAKFSRERIRLAGGMATVQGEVEIRGMQGTGNHCAYAFGGTGD
ncbi:hypothetical protein GCM10007898_01630 [Dyella flagellata]|uniref:Uncharacterized protein n=1 Tax=Dyella flagellata TaxID=1867833 RepID=A0ABQ5X621_9GAMM|nr:hypothetical protein GCM10007898_01630 [Dyella flagellata]